MNGLEFVGCDEIKAGVTYYLTADFYPHGGTAVALRKFFPAKDEWPKTKGFGAIMQSENGMLFVIHPKGVVFASNPNETKPE